MSNEQIILGFLKTQYSDEKLAALLAHAEDGKLAFGSCCCFIGVVTADHALRGAATSFFRDIHEQPHYQQARALPDALEAEQAFADLSGEAEDEQRRAAIIPLIKAEMARRETERNSEVSKPELAHTV